jgi:hypothetical protein
LFVDDSEEEPEGLEEEADVHQDVLALKAVLLDELEEEHFQTSSIKMKRTVSLFDV